MIDSTGQTPDRFHDTVHVRLRHLGKERQGDDLPGCRFGDRAQSVGSPKRAPVVGVQVGGTVVDVSADAHVAQLRERLGLRKAQDFGLEAQDVKMIGVSLGLYSLPFVASVLKIRFKAESISH